MHSTVLKHDYDIQKIAYSIQKILSVRRTYSLTTHDRFHNTATHHFFLPFLTKVRLNIIQGLGKISDVVHNKTPLQPTN